MSAFVPPPIPKSNVIRLPVRKRRSVFAPLRSLLDQVRELLGVIPAPVYALVLFGWVVLLGWLLALAERRTP